MFIEQSLLAAIKQTFCIRVIAANRSEISITPVLIKNKKGEFELKPLEETKAED